MGRGFADIRSQVLLQNIFPANYRQIWCDPNIPLREVESTSDRTPPGSSQTQTRQDPNLMAAAVGLTNQIRGKLLYNFAGATSFPTLNIALFVFVLGSCIFLNVTGYRSKNDGISAPQPFWNNRSNRIALGMILIGVLTNEFVIARLLGIERGLDLSTIRIVRTIEKLLLFGGGSILAGKWIAALVDRLLWRIRIQVQDGEHAEQLRALVLCLAIPWFILFDGCRTG